MFFQLGGSAPGEPWTILYTPSILENWNFSLSLKYQNKIFYVPYLSSFCRNATIYCRWRCKMCRDAPHFLYTFYGNIIVLCILKYAIVQCQKNGHILYFAELFTDLFSRRFCKLSVLNFVIKFSLFFCILEYTMLCSSKCIGTTNMHYATYYIPWKNVK